MTTEQPDWHKGDAIVAREGCGMGRVPFVAEHEPTAKAESVWKRFAWNYAAADATLYRLATHEDVKASLLDFTDDIERRREGMRTVIDLIPMVRTVENKGALCAALRKAIEVETKP